jgi:RND family efflux transporter MFP subunit
VKHTPRITWRRACALLLGALPVAVTAGECNLENLYPVEPVTSATNVSVGGTVVARKEVTLSAQYPGRVEMIAGDEGDSFRQGTELVRLDIDDLLAQRQAAAAQLSSARSALRNADIQYRRELVSPRVAQSTGGMGMPAMMDQFFTNPMQEMMGTRRPGAERSAEIHNRGTALEQARHAVQQAESRLREIDAHIRDARSVAPFDGVITHKHVEVGDPVQPGQPLLGYMAHAGLQVQVDVPARLRPGLEEGMRLTARLDVTRRPVPVRLARIFPTADADRHTVRMKFDLPEGIDAAAGTYAEVLFPDPSRPERQVVAVPRTAVLNRGGLEMVFLVDPNNRAQLRFVRTGGDVGADKVRVLAGLNGGECVVADPRPGLRSGDPVVP